MIEYRAYFGDGEKTFALPTPEIIKELEDRTGGGIGALHWRLANSQFTFSDTLYVIRLALVGGGTAPRDADQLVALYVIGRPWRESHLLALGIMNAVFYGVPEDVDDDFDVPHDDTRKAAATGDLTASINEALKQVTE